MCNALKRDWGPFRDKEAMPQDFLGIVVSGPAFTPLPLLNESGLTRGLLRGLEDRPVEAPLTLRDLFPGEIFLFCFVFRSGVCVSQGSDVLSLPHTFAMGI